MSEASLPLPRRGRQHARLVPLHALSDERLGKLAASGDRKAFAAIYQRHHQALYRYCRSILRDEEEARDALQSTMASALRALEGEQREISVKPWLFRIAHNESVSLLRRRRPRAEMAEAEELPAEAGADSDTRTRLRELMDDLRQLPPRQRGALVMRELSGLDYEEIGAALGVSAQAATQTVYEARQGLQELSEGREMSCDEIRVLISEQDRRRLRGRKVRAHLRACDGCREFERALRRRPAELGALFPAIPAAAATGLLHGILGGGGGKGGAGLLASIFSGGGSQAAGTTVAAKAIAVVAVTATAGAGAVEVVKHQSDSSKPAADSRLVPVDVASPVAKLHARSDVLQFGAPGQTGDTRRPHGAAAATSHNGRALGHAKKHKHHGHHRALGHTKGRHRAGAPGQIVKQQKQARVKSPSRPVHPPKPVQPKAVTPAPKAKPVPRVPAIPAPQTGDAVPKIRGPKLPRDTG